MLELAKSWQNSENTSGVEEKSKLIAISSILVFS
jgi:hypothetical protein